MKVKDLFDKAADYNPREVDDEKLLQLNETMRELGSLDGIVYNVRTETLVSGHQRIKVLESDWVIEKQPHKDSTGTIAVGYILSPSGDKFPYREVDWDKEKEMSANLAANTPTGMWNFEKKTKILEHLIKAKANLRLTGQSPEEIKHSLLAATKDAELQAQALKEKIEKERQEKPKFSKEEQDMAESGADSEDLALNKSIEVKVYLPAGLVLKADKEAMAQGLSDGKGRSIIVQMALEEYLNA